MHRRACAGISLFIVPKFLVGADGKLGKRNDLRCVSLEHKLGIHASPTCVMSFGDDGGAVGYLIGEEGRGLSYMFTMMNNARLSVGIQGLAIAERAYQQAAAFARTRVQSKDDGSPKPEPVAIVHHADVRRMLMTMRAQIEAMRALGYYTAAGIDGALRHPDKETARKTQDRVDLLIPIVKAWFTDLGNEIASVGVQIHGGMGFIEETGAAQHLRDARILPIYEGTNGIQARDLVGRKVIKDGGETMRGWWPKCARSWANSTKRRATTLRRSRPVSLPRRTRWRTPPPGWRNPPRPTWSWRWRARFPSCGWPAPRWAGGCWPGAR
jgi:alkylation response protein AidB-like acyl-CoA dehydrogenase